MNVLPLEKQIRVISALTEGCSMRTAARICGVNRETVMTLNNRIGEGCERLHDGMMRNLQAGVIELDEQWAFIAKKAKHVRDGDPKEYGDAWVMIALSATHKAVLAYKVGRRTAQNVRELVADLSMRIINRPQITSDGLEFYVSAVDNAFGWDVDYAMVHKTYEAEHSAAKDAAHRYSPARVRSAEKEVLRGDPDRDKISTSYVERFNLSTRMNMRRFTRLTNGFSKKLDNHRAAISLWIAYYNFCRAHETLGRSTPAMALGVTNHIWSIAELIAAATDETEPPELTTPEVVREKIGKPTLRVIRGGKA